MAITKPEVEWLVQFPERWLAFGVVCLAGKWAVVRAEDSNVNNSFKVVSPWVDDRKTAIGFLKLLKE